jgi:hypothetical protein
MARQILSDYGPERRTGSRPTGLSRPGPRDVLNYKPPQGPTNITESKSPGLHGANLGYCGSQESTSCGCDSSGSPGLGGSMKMVQGRH